MGWSKQNLIDKAYEQIGLASYVFDISPEMYKSALMSLDSMMALWSIQGIRPGPYPLPTSPANSNLADDSNLPDWANRAVFMRLGIDLASERGKPVSTQLLSNADIAYNAMLTELAKSEEMEFPPGTLAGAGNRRWGYTGRVFLGSDRSGLALTLHGKGKNQ